MSRLSYAERRPSVPRTAIGRAPFVAVACLVAILAGRGVAQSESRFVGAPPATARPPESRPAETAAASRPRRGGRREADAAAYVRVAGRGAERRLETGWKTFTREDGRTIVLVGAVHVADAEYFAAIDALLGRVDYVFYEGVSGEPTPEMTMVGRLQLALGKILDLTFQKDGVRYGRPHFVHADLDAREIAERLAARGESLLPGGPGLKLFGPLLTGFLDRAAESAERERKAGRTGAGPAMKSAAADLLADAGRLGDLRSRAFDEVVIGDRNAEVMETLAPFLARGPGVYAIFYGAAHLPDFERRLAALGFRGGEAGFLPAWRLGAKAPLPAAPSASTLRGVGRSAL